MTDLKRMVLEGLLLCCMSAAAAGTAVAATPLSVTCNRNTVGQYWPESVNADRSQIWLYVQSGELKICTAGWRHYRWQSWTVNYNDLKAEAEKKHSKERGEKAALRSDPPVHE
jgi:hypothetical protein